MPPFMSNTPGPVARPSATVNGRCRQRAEREHGVVVADDEHAGRRPARQCDMRARRGRRRARAASRAAARSARRPPAPTRSRRQVVATVTRPRRGERGRRASRRGRSVERSRPNRSDRPAPASAWACHLARRATQCSNCATRCPAHRHRPITAPPSPSSSRARREALRPTGRPPRRPRPAHAGPAARGGGDARRRVRHVVHVARAGPPDQRLDRCAAGDRARAAPRRRRASTISPPSASRPPAPPVADRYGPDDVPSALRRLIAAFEPAPAYVLGPHWEFAAWNAAQARLYPPHRSLPDERPQPVVGAVRRPGDPRADRRLGHPRPPSAGRVPRLHDGPPRRPADGRAGRAAAAPPATTSTAGGPSTTSPASRPGCAASTIPIAGLLTFEYQLLAPPSGRRSRRRAAPRPRRRLRRAPRRPPLRRLSVTRREFTTYGSPFVVRNHDAALDVRTVYVYCKRLPSSAHDRRVTWRIGGERPW